MKKHKHSFELFFVYRPYEMDAINCKFCPYKTKNINNLKNNWELRSHEKAKHFYCYDCDLQHSSKKDIFSHLKKLHQNWLKECLICGYATVYTHSLNQHKILQHFFCNKCNIDHVTEEDLSKHMVDIHQAQKNFTCPKCNFTTLVERKLKHHVASIHTAERYSCGTCGKMFKFKCQMKSHLKHCQNTKISSNLKSETKSRHDSKGKWIVRLEILALGKLKCEHCETLFCSTKSLLSHQNNFHERMKIQIENCESDLKCVFCSETFESKENLQEHIHNLGCNFLQKRIADIRKKNCK